MAATHLGAQGNATCVQQEQEKLLGPAILAGLACM